MHRRRRWVVSVTIKYLRRTAAAVFGGALLATSALTGCGSDGTSGGEDTVEFWSMWRQGEPQQVVLQAAIDAFEKESGVTVKTQWAGREVGKKISAGANIDKVPDLTDNSAEQLLAMSNAGQALGLDDVFDMKLAGESGRTVGDASPAKYVEPYKGEKGATVVPYELLTTSLWFDGAAHPELAGKKSVTWTEFMTTLDDIKGKGQAPIAADGTITDYNAYWLTGLVDRYLGPGWLHKAAQDKTGKMWQDPKFLQAAKDVHKLVRGGYFMKGYEGSKLPAGQQRWAEGEAAFLLMGSWAPADTKAQAKKDFEYRTIPFPDVPGGHNAANDVNPIGFGIPAKAKNPDAAKKFIAFFMAKKWLSQISTKANNLTPDPTIPAPEVLKDVPSILKATTETHRLTDGVPADFPKFWQTVFTPIQDKLFFGKITPEQYVAKLRKESAAYWKNNA